MQGDQVERIAQLLYDRNEIDKKIAGIIHRPMAAGHLGEWLAAEVFDLELEPSAVAVGIDGRFRSGPLAGQAVNVKWYLKREGLLDVSEAEVLDYYLVLAGPTAAAMGSRDTARPWCIESVHLFDARTLLADLRARGLRVGVASSVRAAQWAASEIYPRENTALPLNAGQRRLLGLFAPA